MISVSTCNPCISHVEQLKESGLIHKIEKIDEEHPDFHSYLDKIKHFPSYIYDGKLCDISGDIDSPELECEDGSKYKLKEL